jgi:rod shape-determining protein MreC
VQSNLKLAIGGLFLPAYGASGSADELAVSASYAVLSRDELVRQIESLRQTNQLFQMRLMQAEEWRKENDRLRHQLGITRQFPWNLKLARVVALDPANWWRTIQIDRGARDGIVPNAPVLTVHGLVGRVSEVGYAHSQVVLVGDPDCRVSVLIGDERNREQGFIAPATSNPSDDALVDLTYISRHSKLAAGQVVVTSGHGNIFPKGIVVGQIADFRTVGFGLYKEARVSLAVKMNALEEVWVKVP